VAIKMIAVGFGKPRPGENSSQDLAHLISFALVSVLCTIP
jgi:hypothetical protein